jgi:hypothetical protein
MFGVITKLNFIINHNNVRIAQFITIIKNMLQMLLVGLG